MNAQDKAQGNQAESYLTNESAIAGNADKPESEDISNLQEAAFQYKAEEDEGYTIEDYYALPDERRVELIDGKFYDMAAPRVVHQIILGELYLQFASCIKANGMKCKVYLSPCDVQINQDNRTMVQPDLFVLCREIDKSARAISGAPDLIVEILSPSNRPVDMVLKLNKYYYSGVREYWIVDPENRKIMVYDFTESSLYPEYYSFEDRIPVRISEGKCTIDFSLIKEELEA